MTFPLLTLLGLAERPGEAHGLGALDPDLVRGLASAGARHPASEFCVTVVDEHGYAIGHGCCKPIRAKPSAKASTSRNPGNAGMATAGAATFNPRITSTAVFNPGVISASPGVAGASTFSPGMASAAVFDPSMASTATSHPGMADAATFHARITGTATFHRSGRAGPDGGFGSWVLTLPGAPLPFTVDIGPVPTYDCDHRYASTGYAPSGKLRHLIQARTATCAAPDCDRPAAACDLDHTVAWDDSHLT